MEFDAGFTTVRDSKNGESRHVPMDSTVVELSREWQHTNRSEFVFTNAAGGRLAFLQKGFRKALARVGLSDLHFHDLRHTVASHWMMNSGDLCALKSILGHKSIAMTQRYAHLSAAYKKTMSIGWSKSGRSQLFGPKANYAREGNENPFGSPIALAQRP